MFRCFSIIVSLSLNVLSSLKVPSDLDAALSVLFASFIALLSIRLPTLESGLERRPFST